MDNTPSDPLIGRAISQYEVVARIGGGGMGVVYKATDLKLGRSVALKFLPPQWSHDDGAKQRFLREAQAASATNHRNICIIHDIAQTDDGQLFIVMAYYEGETLKQKLERGPLPAAEALEIAAEIAEGLAKAHAQGVVHRDVKPGNLMITDDGVKVLDFGLAKFADSLHLTMAGSTVGTVAYMSPEQARGEEADARSDVWALGVVLYEMLTGGVPFKGSYPEATFHAIKNEPVPPLRIPGTADHEIPPALEMLVLRALEKDPERRYQSAREVARDIRMLQGRTVPLDLLTGPLQVAQGVRDAGSRRRSRKRLALMAAVTLIAAFIGSSIWLTWPVQRVPIIVAPLVNQTGYAELDGYRLALTHTLVTELGESQTVRVFPYNRLVQILSPFRSNGTDISSREVIQALTTHSASQFILVPTLLYENGSWRARAEVRNAETATNAAVYETDPVVSSLSKDTAYGLMAGLAGRVERHFQTSEPWRLSVVRAIRRLRGGGSQPAGPGLRTLDAAAAFEQAVSAYDQLEYASAQRSFVAVTEQDPQSPLAFAWSSRVAEILHQDNVSHQAATEAARLVTPRTPAVDALFVTAVSAESQRDYATAEARYRELVARSPDDATWLIELAGFEDRRTRWADAVASYLQALRLDSGLVGAHLELCRDYARLNEAAPAKQEGERALAAFRAIGNRSGEAQALMCLTNVLRLGSPENQLEARGNAGAALKIFQEMGYQFNLARAEYYVGLAAEAHANPAEIANLYERSLATARKSGNVVLEPLILMNAGGWYEELGDRSRAIDYYQQSRGIFERFGDDLRAAQVQANAGAILIEYAGKSEEGLRDIENARRVFEKLADKDFEIFAAKVTAASYRYAGRYGDAERELNRALALANERDIRDKIPGLTIDLARLRFESGQYAAARDLLVGALGDGSGKDSVGARLQLGLVYARLGTFDAAQDQLSQASRDIDRRGDVGRLPILHEAMGELAYESRQLGDARTHFARAAALWVDGLPDPASVQARAELGLLDALQGRAARGRPAVQASLEQAQRMGLLPLEVRCRLMLARIDVGEGRFQDALNILSAIQPGGERVIGAEPDALAHYWRSRAQKARGDISASQSEAAAARKLIESLTESLPAANQRAFASRPDIVMVMK